MRQRDYKKEYAQRKANAQKKGYSGYSERRKARSRAKVLNTALTTNMTSFLAAVNDLESFLEDDSAFWQALREFYNEPI